jgi:hypothetical protein
MPPETDRCCRLLSTDERGAQMFDTSLRRNPTGFSRGQGSRRTFARLTAFDVACPQCLSIDSVSCLLPWWKRKANFDPVRSRWRCRVCRRVFAVGLALWPVSRAGNRPREQRPADTIPTGQELMGLLLVAQRGWGDPVNLTCECEDGPASPACPLHAPGSPDAGQPLHDSRIRE